MGTPEARPAARPLRAWYRTPPLVAGVLAGLAALGALVATRDGPGLAPDSVTYVSAARNLADGRGVTDFTGGALTAFPPGYPALMAGGELVGIDAMTAGRAVNVLALAAVVVLTFLLLRRHVTSGPVLIGATAFVAFSVQLLRIAGYVASDPPFIALTLAFILVMELGREAVESGSPGRVRLLLAIAAGVVGVTFLVRYAASALLVVGAIVVALGSRNDGPAAVARRALGFGALAAVLPAIWVLRNATTDAPHLLGLRVASEDSPVKTFKDTAGTFKHYVFPDSTRNTVAVVLALVVAVVVGTAAWRARRELVPRITARAESLLPLATLAVVSTAFLLVTRKTTGNDIEPRMFLPVWIAIVVVGASLLEDLLAATGRGGSRWLPRLVVVIALALVVGAAAQFVHAVGVGTETDYRTDSRSSRELERGLRQLPASARLLSNDPWRTYTATEERVELAPMEVRSGFSHTPVTVAEIKRSLCAGAVYVVWFPDSPASKRLPARSLTDGTGLTLHDRQRVDGADLYEIGRARDAPDPSC